MQKHYIQATNFEYFHIHFLPNILCYTQYNNQGGLRYVQTFIYRDKYRNLNIKINISIFIEFK